MKIVLIFLFFLVQGCDPCIKVPLLENEKFWFSNYETGDKIIFKSQANDFDTLLITNKVINKPTGECNPLVSNFDKEFVRVDYSMKKDTFRVVNDYFIQLSANERNKSLPILRLLNIECSSLKSNLLKLKISEVNPNWKNVYTFNRNNCPYMNFNGKFGIVEFEWDKNFGLVSYSNTHGEKWVLFSKEQKLPERKEIVK